MQISKVDGDISVAPQIAVADIPAIAEAGFKTVICNRLLQIDEIFLYRRVGMVCGKRTVDRFEQRPMPAG